MVSSTPLGSAPDLFSGVVEFSLDANYDTENEFAFRQDQPTPVELHEDGQLVATPRVRVTLGRPAAVTMGGDSLRFRMEQASGGDYVIRSSLYRSEGGWTRLAAPTLTVAEGEQARARFAAADGSDLSLAVLVR